MGSSGSAMNKTPFQQSSTSTKKVVDFNKLDQLIKNEKTKNLFNENEFETQAEITPAHLLDIYFINEKEKKRNEVWKKDEAMKEGNGGTEGIFRAFQSYNIEIVKNSYIYIYIYIITV